MTYPWGSNLKILWDQDPKMMGVRLSRYKFVSKMLKGMDRVLEIGAGDGVFSKVVEQEVGSLDLCDLNGAPGIHGIDYTKAHLGGYDAVYALDVFEHVQPADEDAFMVNVCRSLEEGGTCIIGIPSLELQAHASWTSKASHVNCKTEEDFRATMQRYFRCVYLFGMSDEVVHTGFGPMCSYRLAIANSPR